MTTELSPEEAKREFKNLRMAIDILTNERLVMQKAGMTNTDGFKRLQDEFGKLLTRLAKVQRYLPIIPAPPDPHRRFF